MTPGPLAAALATTLVFAPPAAAAPAPSDRSIAPDAVASVVVTMPLETGSRGQDNQGPRAGAGAPEGPPRARRVRFGCPGSSACRRLVALGATTGGLGVAAIATGVVLLARPAAVDRDDPTTLVTYRPAGAALLAIGAGLAATWLLTLLAARKAGRLAARMRAGVSVP